MLTWQSLSPLSRMVVLCYCNKLWASNTPFPTFLCTNLWLLCVSISWKCLEMCKEKHQISKLHIPPSRHHTDTKLFICGTSEMEEKAEEQISIRWLSWVWLITFQQAEMCRSHRHAAPMVRSMWVCVCTWMKATLNNGLTWDEQCASCSAVCLIVSQSAVSDVIAMIRGRPVVQMTESSLFSSLGREGRKREVRTGKSEWVTQVMAQTSHLFLLLVVCLPLSLCPSRLSLLDLPGFLCYISNALRSSPLFSSSSSQTQWHSTHRSTNCKLWGLSEVTAARFLADGQAVSGAPTLRNGNSVSCWSGVAQTAFFWIKILEASNNWLFTKPVNLSTLAWHILYAVYNNSGRFITQYNFLNNGSLISDRWKQASRV